MVESKQPEAVFTAEKIQEKINEKLSVQTPFVTDRIGAKIRDYFRERLCCKTCGVLVVVGIVLTIGLIAFLVTAKLTPIPLEGRCNMRCTLRSASWANLTETQVEQFAKLPADHVLDAMSLIFGEKHAVARSLLMAATVETSDMSRLKDAHNRLNVQMKSVADDFTKAQAMPDSAEKATMLQDIMRNSASIQALAADVNSGKAFKEAAGKQLSMADRIDVRTCGEMLRTIGEEPCAEYPGTATSFLRAVGVADPITYHKDLLSMSPTWPVNLHYPGFRTIDADHGIHVVDEFLSREEIEELMTDASTLSVANRSALPASSLAALYSESAHTEKAKRERHVPKWMYSGMAGALIQLDVKGQGQQEPVCAPPGKDQDADAWNDIMAPLFQERGQDVQSCAKHGYGDTSYFDTACPPVSKTLRNVEDKLVKVLQANPKYLQPMQLRHYGRGDFELDHSDIDPQTSNEKVAPLMSVLIFLSEVKGGATYFPSLDVRVHPVPGRLLIFPALTMNLTHAVASIHTEEEVKRGDKWVLTTTMLIGDREGSPNDCMRGGSNA